jgi:hypothetical protein
MVVYFPFHQLASGLQFFFRIQQKKCQASYQIDFNLHSFDRAFISTYSINMLKDWYLVYIGFLFLDCNMSKQLVKFISNNLSQFELKFHHSLQYKFCWISWIQLVKRITFHLYCVFVLLHNRFSINVPPSWILLFWRIVLNIKWRMTKFIFRKNRIIFLTRFVESEIIFF